MQEKFDADIHTKVESLIQLKVKDRLLARIEELGTRVGFYRRVWLVRYDRINDTLLDIRPRSTIGGNLGPSVDMPDLLSFSWNEIQVLTPVGPDRYKVKIQGAVFECYTPRHDALFSEEIHLWRKITLSPEAYDIRAPKLKGLVRADRCKPRLRGILYNWIEPWPEARSLADVAVGQVSRGQREIWYKQVACSIDAVHKLGLRCTCLQPYWTGDVVRRVIIDGNLNANFSMVAFGSWCEVTNEEAIKPGGRRKWKLDASPGPGFAFLDILREFLRLRPEHGTVQLSADQANRKPTRSNFDALSAEIRNMIYERVLEDKGPVMYRHEGFVRQVPRTSKFWTKSLTSEMSIPGKGLFLVSKGMR